MIHPLPIPNPTDPPLFVLCSVVVSCWLSKSVTRKRRSVAVCQQIFVTFCATFRHFIRRKHNLHLFLCDASSSAAARPWRFETPNGLSQIFYLRMTNILSRSLISDCRPPTHYHRLDTLSYFISSTIHMGIMLPSDSFDSEQEQRGWSSSSDQRLLFWEDVYNCSSPDSPRATLSTTTLMKCYYATTPCCLDRYAKTDVPARDGQRGGIKRIPKERGGWVTAWQTTLTNQPTLMRYAMSLLC